MTVRDLLNQVRVDLATACSDEWCPDPELARAELLIADGLIRPGVPPEQVAHHLARAESEAWGTDALSRILLMLRELLDHGLLNVQAVTA